MNEYIAMPRHRLFHALLVSICLSLPLQAFAGGSAGFDPPPECDDQGGDTFVDPVSYVEREFFSPMSEDCPGDYQTVSNFSNEEHLVTERSFIAEANATIAASTTCKNIDDNTILCLGNPVSSDVTLSYAWSASGPISVTHDSMTDPTAIAISCLPDSSGQGAVTLTVSSPLSAAPIPSTRSITCTADAPDDEEYEDPIGLPLN